MYTVTGKLMVSVSFSALLIIQGKNNWLSSVCALNVLMTHSLMHHVGENIVCCTI